MRATQTTRWVVVIGLLAVSQASSSGEWNLRRNTSNGACSVHPSESRPLMESAQVPVGEHR